MKFRVFLDTNVFIYSFEFPDSNSSKIIELLDMGKIEAITSERVLKEVTHYFEKEHSLILARKFRKFILELCIVIMKNNVIQEIESLKGIIKDKDIEQLAVTIKYGIKFLISFDRDFEGIEEYTTPKEFLKLIKLKTRDTEF
ncbi:PIN domain-containing protein [Candidatus Pacearchaeota archaeon]|nr:PIN domain-containing protein [Candidatus Pacearchaeota archaeon]